MSRTPYPIQFIWLRHWSRYRPLLRGYLIAVDLVLLAAVGFAILRSVK